MKRCVVYVSLFIFVSVISFHIMLNINPQLILANIKPSYLVSSPVYATLPKGSVLYDNYNGKAIDLLLSGSKVEIIKDRSRQWYYVKFNNKLGWVKKEALSIPPDSATNKSEISQNEFIEYANSNLGSKTSHYVWVDISRQKIYVLKKSNNSWQFEKTITCSTGKNTSPSIRGEFTIKDRGKWFYSDRLGSGAKNWVRYNDSYLFHSVAMDKNQNIIDPTLGRKSSNGCIRMSVDDSEWFYNNIEENSSITID